MINIGTFISFSVSSKHHLAGGFYLLKPVVNVYGTLPTVHLNALAYKLGYIYRAKAAYIFVLG